MASQLERAVSFSPYTLERAVSSSASSGRTVPGYHCSRGIRTCVKSRPKHTITFGTNVNLLYKLYSAQCLEINIAIFCFQFLSGAVVAVRRLLYPVTIARKIMVESPHCALSGEGALEFAEPQGTFEGTSASEDLDGRQSNRSSIRNDRFDNYSGKMVGELPSKEKLDQRVRDSFDSVAAVAIDENGHLACANSSGI